MKKRSRVVTVKKMVKETRTMKPIRLELKCTQSILNALGVDNPREASVLMEALMNRWLDQSVELHRAMRHFGIRP